MDTVQLSDRKLAFRNILVPFETILSETTQYWIPQRYVIMFLPPASTCIEKYLSSDILFDDGETGGVEMSAPGRVLGIKIPPAAYTVEKRL